MRFQRELGPVQKWGAEGRTRCSSQEVEGTKGVGNQNGYIYIGKSLWGKGAQRWACKFRVGGEVC